MDVNKHERLSNITLRHIKVKEHYVNYPTDLDTN